ncbi:MULTISPECIES: hypothetical protein [unclassified Serratia (in: enterobacteria)]|uniref:hypothetical protein n=1 Tax=unclassified Serratia (in: enterobacteria) TaxID=2647522 RepID=UPI003075F2AD
MSDKFYRFQPDCAFSALSDAELFSHDKINTPASPSKFTIHRRSDKRFTIKHL